jgi:hypothetical protein
VVGMASEWPTIPELTGADQNEGLRLAKFYAFVAAAIHGTLAFVEKAWPKAKSEQRINRGRTGNRNSLLPRSVARPPILSKLSRLGTRDFHCG